MEKRKSDSRYIDESFILKDGPIKSVYTCMNPRINSYDEEFEVNI